MDLEEIGGNRCTDRWDSRLLKWTRGNHGGRVGERWRSERWDPFHFQFRDCFPAYPIFVPVYALIYLLR